MRRHLKVLGAAAVMTLLLASCFKIGGFRFTKMATNTGEKTVLEVSLFPLGFEEGNRDYVFLIISIPVDDTDPEGGTTDYKVTNPKIFDTKGNFGGPHNLVADGALRTWVLDENNSCYDDIRNPSNQIVVLRTPVRVHDQSKLSKNALTKIGLKHVTTTEPFTGASFFVQVISGAWDDDVNDKAGAGIPEDDEILCLSDFSTNFTVKGDGGAAPKLREVRRAGKAASGK